MIGRGWEEGRGERIWGTRQGVHTEGPRAAVSPPKARSRSFLDSVLRETDADGQASGGSDSGDWIFTIREKDPKSLENGALQPSDLERNKVCLLVLE